MSFDVLTVYAVRNAEGQWMRSTGFGGGKHWVPNVCDAKLYTKLSQARGRVTFWANTNPSKPAPVIIAFVMSLSGATVMTETDRVEAAKLRKATEAAENEKREAKRRIEAAEKTIERANAEIAKLRGQVDPDERYR